MKRLGRNSLTIRAYLRDLGNPYASLQMFDENDGAFMRSNEVAIQKVRVSQNPYSVHYYLDDEPKETAAVVDTAPFRHSPLKGMPKAEFRKVCSAFFKSYTPEIENGRIGDIYRNFIARNELRSPISRARIIVALRRYDLSGMHGFRPHFNRERGPKTEAKLGEIERLAGVED